MTAHQVTLIGCGKMGSAMLEGWLADAALDANFTIIEPERAHLGWVEDQPRVRHYKDCDAAMADNAPASTIVVLAVKPQMMDEALHAMGGMAADADAFLSIAAGISTGWLQARLGSDVVVMRAMPNTPAAIGKGVTALFVGHASESISALAAQLLAAVGAVVPLQDESLMDAVTAVSGSGPAYVFLLAEAMAEAGVKAGLPEPLARQLAEATVSGAGALMAAVDTTPDILRQNVTSKGGTTAAALSVLMAEDGLASLMTRAVAAAKARSIELGS
jgi:pyrroline-5-carboxylate reductase